MSTTIFCKKLHRQASALSKAPFPGDLGEKILNEISEEAWKMWLEEQKKIINEEKLQLFEPIAQTYLTQKMKEYFF